MSHAWHAVVAWFQSVALPVPAPLPAAVPPHVYLIEGNIAVGKSTLCRALAAACPGIVAVQEHVGDMFMQRFYEAPDEYGFALQMTLHAERVKLLLLARLAATQTTLAPATRAVLLDRSLLGDWAFAAWNTATGTLTPPQWALYLDRAGATPLAAMHRAGITPATATVVFLHDDAPACRGRVLQRDGVDSGGATDEYLAGLDAAHLLVMAAIANDWPVVQMPWAAYSTPDGVARVKQAIVAGAPDRVAGCMPATSLAYRARIAIDCIASAGPRVFLETLAHTLLDFTDAATAVAVAEQDWQQT